MAPVIIDESPHFTNYQGDLPGNLINGSTVSVDRMPAAKIYGVGFQPAKSIPELPRWFLKKYVTPGQSIIDPFAGSGTTLLEALKFGAVTRWVDYHPLSKLICATKTVYLDLDQLRIITARILNQANAIAPAPHSVVFHKIDFWFQKPVQEGLAILRLLISAVPEPFSTPLWVAFASTVRKTSDMNDSMILPAKRSNIAETPQYERLDVFKYFSNYMQKAIEALTDWYQSVDIKAANCSEIQECDARDFGGQFDAIITSPPYINAIDYVWATKFELHWLGAVKSDSERLELTLREIGTERISRKDCKSSPTLGHKKLDELLANIFHGTEYRASVGQNQLRSHVVAKYFRDMRVHFRNSSARLKPSGFYCLAIGERSRICGVDVPVAELLREIASECGLEPIFNFNLLLQNRRLNIPRNVDWATTIKHDSITVFQKTVPCKNVRIPTAMG